jgi:hypothetical protein
MPRGLSSFCLTVGLAASATGQARPDTARFTESVRATVTTRSGVSVRERRIVRDVRYRFASHGDTTAVFADSIRLVEIEGGVREEVDVDAVVGGRWLMVGRRVVERPFVPLEVSEVSDLAVAMDDFFPPVPPALTVGGEVRVGPTQWHRLDDSSATMRYRWTTTTTRDSTHFVADSVPLQASEDRTESGGVTRSADGRPIGWRREITSRVSSTVRGRTVHAEVSQVITVRRDP